MAPTPGLRAVLAALLASGAGHVIHNLVEFPVAVLLGWETLFPLAVTALLGLAWVLRPGRGTFASMAVWAAVVLVLGGGSVAPFGILPFVPEQSAAHYATHLVHALAQLPLLRVGLEGLRADGGGTAESRGG